LLLLTLSRAAPAEQNQRLFTITRSKNSNALHYEVRLDARGTPRPDPVHAYWIMHEQGGRREAPTWMELKLAYGWEIVSGVEPSGFSLKLRAFDKRVLKIRRKGKGYHAVITIAGKPAELARVHVKTREGGIVPKVIYVELFGTDAAGKPVKERIAND
jgi:hypothetical protein